MNLWMTKLQINWTLLICLINLVSGLQSPLKPHLFGKSVSSDDRPVNGDVGLGTHKRDLPLITVPPSNDLSSLPPLSSLSSFSYKASLSSVCHRPSFPEKLSGPAPFSKVIGSHFSLNLFSFLDSIYQT